MLIGVKVMPRKEVLDSQGRAVETTLKQNGQTISACRVGRYIELEIEASADSVALEKAKEIAEFVLYNPLVEDFELEVLNTPIEN